MGARFSKGRDAPATTAETAVAEQKPAAEPAATQPAGDSGTPQTQEAVKTENLEVVLGEAVTVKACLPNEECVAECKAPEAPAASDPLTDAEPEAVAKETPAPAPVQPEPVVSVSEPEPEPVAEAQLAPEPVPEPEPVSEPEPVPEPEPEVETVPEPIPESVPVPAEALEQQVDLLNQESLPEPLVDLGVPDVTPPAADIPAPVIADVPSDIPVTEECSESAEVSVIPAFELETPECVENLIEVEAGGDLEQLVSDVNEEDVCGLLKNLELKGNDLVADLIPNNDKISDGMNASTELM